MWVTGDRLSPVTARGTQGTSQGPLHRRLCEGAPGPTAPGIKTRALGPVPRRLEPVGVGAPVTPPRPAQTR